MARDKGDKESLLRSSRSYEGSSHASLSYGAIKDEKVAQSPSRFLCTKRDTVVVVIALLLACVVITTTLLIGLPKIKEKETQYYDTSFHPSSSPLRSFSKSAVVADGKPCAAIGKSILEQAGSAVDAAIASLFCNGIVVPESMGLGGGFFMTVYTKLTKTVTVIDAREVAPAAATADMFHGNATLSTIGGLAVAVPGELKGYWDAHKKFGLLNWDKLIEPSIEICENGFEVSEHMALYLKKLEGKILAIPSMREEFVNNATGEVYQQGDIVKRPMLAKTLRAIAAQGDKVLYDGDFTKQFVQDIQDCGGIITEEDLRNYKTKIRVPLEVKLKGDTPLTLYTIPPPGSGAIISLILNILEGYGLTASTMDDLDTAVLNYHRLTEAFKFAFAQRENLADTDFVAMTELISNLTSKAFAEALRERMSDERTFDPAHYEATYTSPEDHGTSQVSVLAPNGDAVSVTSTINTYFGSLCMSPSTGILLNNDMDDFSSPNITNYSDLRPFPNNNIEPGKRPLSSMSPSIAVNDEGNVVLVLGGMGGTHIITAMVETMMRMLWMQADCKEAIDAPRIHHQLFPNYVQYEDKFPKVYLDKLKKYGHQVEADTGRSAVLMIARKEDKIETNVDFRKGGSADGF